MDKLKGAFSSEFEMKDLGPARKILSMKIYQDRSRGILHLSQGGYISKVLEKFEMDKAKLVGTPLASHMALLKQQCPKQRKRKSTWKEFPMLVSWGV